MIPAMHQLYRALWRTPLPVRRKKFVYKKLCAYGEAMDVPFSTNFFGLRYQGNLNNSIEFNIFFYGAFEKHLLFFLRDATRRLQEREEAVGSCFCDVGANIGQHALFMSRRVERVYAFEPFLGVSDSLRRHIDLNAISNIELIELGLSDVSESLPYFAPTGHNQGIGSFDSESQDKGNRGIGQLEVQRGDEFFAAIALPDTVVFKIDVEGFEKKVIRGLTDTLHRHRPLLVCEISYGKPLSFDSAEELSAALPDDYRLLCFDNRKADGRKARRRGAKARISGQYRIVEFDRWFSRGQDDVIACPEELLPHIPRSNL